MAVKYREAKQVATAEFDQFGAAMGLSRLCMIMRVMCPQKIYRFDSPMVTLYNRILPHIERINELPGNFNGHVPTPFERLKVQIPYAQFVWFRVN
jgi:hypothetical protein